MATFGTLLVLSTNALLFASSGHCEKHFLNDGRAEAKLVRIRETTGSLAQTILNLTTDGAGSSFQLPYLSNELTNRVQSAIYGINQGIAAVMDKSFHDGLADVVDSFSELNCFIQHDLHGDAAKLKETLATAVKGYGDITIHISRVAKENKDKADPHISNQIRKSLNEVLYAVQKLKYEIEFYTLTSGELAGEIESALGVFINAIRAVKAEDPNSQEELLHLIQNLERVEEGAVVKLENFVHTNPDETSSIAIVHEVSKGLSSSCDAFHKLTTAARTVAELRNEFEAFYKTATDLFKKLLDIETYKSRVAQQYIKSILFDSITLSHTYAAELKNIA